MSDGERCQRNDHLMGCDLSQVYHGVQRLTTIKYLAKISEESIWSSGRYFQEGIGPLAVNISR